jgi:hypothetical protein
VHVPCLALQYDCHGYDVGLGIHLDSSRKFEKSLWGVLPVFLFLSLIFSLYVSHFPFFVIESNFYLHAKFPTYLPTYLPTIYIPTCRTQNIIKQVRK